LRQTVTYFCFNQLLNHNVSRFFFNKVIEQETGDLDDEEERRRRARRGGGTIRRKSRVTRQRSYDDEIKTAAAMGGGGAQPTHSDTGLGLPVQLPRRASAYDVYAAPGSSGLNAMAIAAAQQRASISAQGALIKIKIKKLNLLISTMRSDGVVHKYL
jgi:hypothetical protein